MDTNHGTTQPQPQPSRVAAVVERLVQDRASLDAVADRLRPIADTARGRGSWRRLVTGEAMGHAAHPFLTDLPIGFFTSAALLDLVGGPGTDGAARRLVGAGIIASPAAAVTGLAEYASLSQGTRRVAVTHALLNVASLGLYAVSWAVRPRQPRAGAALGLAGLTVSGLSAYLGGHMAIGEKVGTTTVSTAAPASPESADSAF
jgi:uncharacterized membrane protein